MDVYKGTGAFSGIAIGKILYYHKSEYQMRQYEITDVKTELNIFRQARTRVMEQLARLAFHALRPVDHHDRRIDGGEGPVGVLGEVLVAGRVDQVETVLAEVEAHRRGGDRDAAVLFHLQEVRPRAPRLALGADLAGHLDRAAEQQELFGQRGFPGVGVRDDREGPAAGDFGRKGGTVRHGHPHSAGGVWPQRARGLAKQGVGRAAQGPRGRVYHVKDGKIVREEFFLGG